MQSSRPPISRDAKSLDNKIDGAGLGSSSKHSSAHPSQSDDAAPIVVGRHAVPQGPSVDLEKARSPEQDKSAFSVGWDDGEKTNPRNFNTWYKAFLTFLLGMLALSASLGSSIIAPAEPAIAQYLGISQEATVLLRLGPLLWAPVSEVHGRKWSILPPLFCLGLFSIGTAVSTTPAALFITRFFGGVFGSSPVSNVSACLGDLYEPTPRGVAVTFYAVCVVGGPTIGPVIGSALTANPKLGWRWTEYVEAIWVFTVVAVSVFVLPEFYGPVLLKRKAQLMRNDTGDERYWHPHEPVKIDPSNILNKHLSRPLKMLTIEPMVTCIAICASSAYGLLDLTLEAFPIVYRENRGWGEVVSTLPPPFVCL